VTERVTLESVLATVQVSCPTSGAQIYVNNQLKGTTPWRGTLAAGNYQMEARLSGYRSQKVTETIAERANRQISIPALQAIVGNLNVNYKPVQSEVWMDGKRLGVTPDVFRNLLVGQHQVEIRKEGYTTKKETVTIADGQTAMLTGLLERQQTAQSQSQEQTTASSSGSAVETITVKGVSFNMVRVDGGTFMMGATSEQGSDAESDEKPAHQVTLSTYSIGETEVTQALWQAVMGSNPSNFKGDQRPVEKVSWDDCQTFIQKLNQLTGRKFRLPTEAEWEYAARGGNKSRGYKYSGSNTISAVAWYDDNSSSSTHDVKTKQANELGLYDMSGNVWEWCQDWYGSYSSGAQTNPTGALRGSNRVDRGGSWFSYARSCRGANRDYCTPGGRSDGRGLRLALQ
jgi:formylglycine-generating enzyme required for sulfatase activity